jgi:perosamine synthetase
MKRIPVSQPDLSGNEERYVVEAVRSSWISSTGKFVDQFETQFAQFAATKYALTVSNGTVALHLALLGLDLRPGDEVLVPSFTYVATANAVRYVGAEPVFVDVDPNTWCIDPKQIEDKITRRTKAIIAVHLYGHPADMDTINEIAAVHGLWVIEDAAEAHGATYKGRPVGGLAHVGTFSFYGNKIISSGEGGAVTLNDPHLYLRLKTLRGQGMDPNRRYFFPVVGYNFRLTNVACALLCAQLERIEAILARRREIYGLYRSHLKGIPGLGLQPFCDVVEHAPWLFCITIDETSYGRSRDQVIRDLAEQGVETRPFFVPLHRLPPYREEAKKRATSLPHTDRLAASGLNLPTFPNMSEQDIIKVCGSLAR